VASDQTNGLGSKKSRPHSTRLPANDVNGNTAVAYSIFLLTIGTPGSADAAIVTASRCFRSLQLACDKLEGGFATLLTLSDEELVEQYQTWLDEPDANKYLKQAIGAFHYFLVQQLGASPLWLRGKAVGIKVPAAAQLLWRHEDERLRTHFASIERADRVDRMSMVIFELARDVPLRISDLRRMKISDLRTVGNDLMLDIREFRNAPRPKTRDTLRSVKITSPSAKRLLEAWRDERLEDLCGEDDQVIEGAWLFGDGFDLKSQVDLAKSYANVTHLLRQLTGDPAIGFHALRHTCISWLMLEALLNADEGTEWDPLDPVAVRAGHASAYSSLTSYFHLAMVAMRARMDRLLRPHVTNRATADWCGMKENTLTIRSKRNPAQDEMALALKTAAAGVSLPSVADSFVLQAAVLVKGGPAPLGVVELLEIITRLDEDKDVNSVANSSGRIVEEIRAVAKFRERVRVVYPGEVHRTKWRNKGKITPLLAHLDRHAKEPATKDGLDAWLQLMDGGRLDASDSRGVGASPPHFAHSRDFPVDALAPNCSS
jgi:integrase